MHPLAGLSLRVRLDIIQRCPNAVTLTSIRPPPPGQPTPLKAFLSPPPASYSNTRNPALKMSTMASAIPSPTPTLPSSPVSGHKTVAGQPAAAAAATTPLAAVSHLASEHSSLLAVFDTAKLAGFPLPAGVHHSKQPAQVWELQSRAGAGSSVVAYLKADGAASQGATILASGPTLSLLLPALANLPAQTTAANRLVVQLSVALPPTESPLARVSPSLAQVSALLPLIPEGFTVVFSASADDIVANTRAIYAAGLADVNVLHVFDGVFAAREVVRALPAATKAAEVEAFTFKGDEAATKVIVLAGGYSAAVLRAATLAPSVGVLTVNALSSTVGGASLLAALPHGGKAVTELVVVDEESAAFGYLRDFVVANVFGRAGTSSGKLPKITGASVVGGETSLENLLYSIGITAPAKSTVSSAIKQTVFFTAADSLLPSVLTKTFLSSPSLSTRVSTLTSLVPAIAQSTVVIAPIRAGASPKPFTSAPRADTSELVFIATAGALQGTGAFTSLKQGGTVLISIAGWDAASVADSLAVQDKQLLAAKNARLLVLPPPAPKAGAAKPSAEEAEAEATALGLVGFFLLFAGVIGEGANLPAGLRSILEAALGPALSELIAAGEKALKEVSIAGFAEVEDDQEDDKRSALTFDGLSSFPAIGPASADAKGPLTASWHVPALHLLFKEAFAVEPTAEERPMVTALAPSLPDKTYLATVTENRRLTPTTYDRNVFHLELSTAGTGLKYEVGEALGVHGWNDEDEVREFLAWYGVEPDAVLSVPVNGKIETRTALQMFQQQVDIFGRPPKGFYAALVAKTDDREEARTLRFISSPEGASMFKKWSENETVTFVDVLKRFPGLKKNVPIEDLVHLVGEVRSSCSACLPASHLLLTALPPTLQIHPRHYSISSAQKFVGDSVHLLVVTVEWNASTGKPRFGQCTRYLANLKIGQQVTVSIKPSVMKLPPLDTQPVIMAGLGTGAAPFRAFIQHRAWQKSQGVTVGPLIYYFGARYSSQEYLYGEEIEAYLAGGLITHAGLAFSRDTKAKVYIQHKMLEDGRLLSDVLTSDKEADKGYFYLCGPTWPVPDVYEALVGSLTANKGLGRSEAESHMEELKEAERYILEVY